MDANHAMHRVQVILRHIHPSHAPLNAALCSSNDRFQLASSLRWNGWGYVDTEFKVNSNRQIELTGTRYASSGKELPSFRAWAEAVIGLNIEDTAPEQAKMKVPEIVNKNEAFLTELGKSYSKISFSDEDRAFHAHGHSCQEIYNLRYGSFPRVPDVVLWPASHLQVEYIVQLAVKHNVAIIPYGGGTTVTHALLPPTDERRMIVSLDMHHMNKLKWINKSNLTACFEAGIIGKEIEELLSPQGLCFGHEPDSHEFSSLGGWVATRASGMKKNVYGNIEDLIVGVKFVSSQGTVEKSSFFPRVSLGPDLQEVILGSEGTLGVVTEVVLKLRPLPETRVFGSIIFPDFVSGFRALHEIGLARAQPASIRLMDNMQFQFGQALKTAPSSSIVMLLDKFKKLYVTKALGFDVNRMAAVTLMFEGSHEQIRLQERKVYQIAAKFGGQKGGEENGLRGYFLTFMIAYLRDFAMKYYFMAESFETSVPYDRVLTLCDNVKERIRRACKARGVPGTPFISCRVTQLYDTGACVYFYFGFIFKGLKDPSRTFSEVEHEAREEVLKCGGSLSHHHGIGKLRKEFLPISVGTTGIHILKGIKENLDPQNIFANGNLI